MGRLDSSGGPRVITRILQSGARGPKSSQCDDGHGGRADARKGSWAKGI